MLAFGGSVPRVPSCRCSSGSAESGPKSAQIHANLEQSHSRYKRCPGSTRIRVGWIQEGFTAYSTDLVRAVNPRSQSRRNLAARGINIPLPGVNGRMLTANQTAQMTKGYQVRSRLTSQQTTASCSLFLFSPFVLTTLRLRPRSSYLLTHHAGRLKLGLRLASVFCGQKTLKTRPHGRGQ